MPYLICYDIANPRRLQKVHRRVVKQALYVQKSVYFYDGNQSGLMQLLSEVEACLHAQEDDVRAYWLGSLSRIESVGQRWLPDGLLMV